ncbi:hypothetical protein AB0G04_32625 [Actinoplanes sp. NPDC023801]|uniref:hypothetical protein n=1 Tax=Actinoplanes sp. NPDC023801 TaxID=3154595 RepID=UPI00340900FB
MTVTFVVLAAAGAAFLVVDVFPGLADEPDDVQPADPHRTATSATTGHFFDIIAPFRCSTAHEGSRGAHHRELIFDHETAGTSRAAGDAA